MVLVQTRRLLHPGRRGGGQLVRVDDRLGRHGQEQQLDASAVELRLEVQDGRKWIGVGRLGRAAHFDGLGAPELAGAQMAQLGGQKQPAVPPNHRRGFRLFRGGGFRGTPRAEGGREGGCRPNRRHEDGSGGRQCGDAAQRSRHAAIP